ncbi:MAG TPA: hypothetical protein PKL31_14775 [Fulvivirga sp.]|nr:hypothetical protein [Fulvivirga sp.]
MKKLILIAALFAFTMANGQLVTEKNLRDGSYGEKKLKKAPKKIYLNQFFINYQVLASSTESSAGGKTRAEMAVGLVGIELEDMQEITNNAYAMVVNKLKAAGVEIVGADEAGKSEFFSDWTRIEGGTPSQAQLLGYISTAPVGYDFYVKKVTKKGKNKGTFFDTTPKLSKELGDIPVFETNVSFQFVTIEGSSSLVTDASRMKGVVNYQMPESAIAKSAEGFFGGKIEVAPVMTRVVWKGGASGLGATTIMAFSPKKKIEIPGVVEQKKFKEYVTPDRNYSTSYSGIVYNNKKELEVSHQVKADREAFKTKTQQALNEYLGQVVDQFIANLNG